MPPELSDLIATECIHCHQTHSPRAELISSPFQSLTALETSPTPAETAAIRDFIRETDAEIVRREFAIARLRCEVAELRRRSEQHEAIIAPIQRVPPEVIAEIFLQANAIEAEYSSYPLDLGRDRDDNLVEKKSIARPLVHRSPLIFGEISRKWRSISLSTPRLWCSISLQCGKQRLQSNSARALCTLWLKRAGSLPLSIRFYRRSGSQFLRGDSSPETIEHFQDLMKTILPYSNRWRFLDFQNLPPSSYDILNDLQLDSVPMLETISVTHDAVPTVSQSTPWAKLQVAPKLTQLSFDKIWAANIVVRGEGRTFPWSNLTRIDVGDCSADDCLWILRQALTAVACRFTVTKASSVEHSLLVHPRLHTLKINVYASVDSLWSHLTCSALSSLSVHAKPHVIIITSFFQGLPGFIARSGSNVKDFTLDSCTLDDHQFMACLGDMPQLRHLHVSEYANAQFTNQVWDSLARAETEHSSPPLIPRLESLVLGGARESSHKSIVRMLKSRLQPATGPVEFKRLRVMFFRNVSQSAEDRLLEFRKLGLDVVVSADWFEDQAAGSETSDSEEDEGDVNDGSNGSECLKISPTFFTSLI
ncbi:hypothetical protein C8F04DRAFT_28765 [Mycena alexandri]|uniref:F-box domain-containing protein n=1 Tax=Mycena alexandri TaxID=1745969 RepID=A0AAD6TBF6_9AGAR|nr:hypothetical protein C8F04DRAFT_28765 [Mycena alexandri]